MTAVLLAAFLGLSTGAHAADIEGTYDIGCVKSEVSLTFSIFDRARPDRALFADRAVLDTGCNGQIDARQANLFRLVLDDLCQVLGVTSESCMDVVRGDLGEFERLTAHPSLDTLSVEPFASETEPFGVEENYAELSLGFADQRNRVLPVSFAPDGSFETREVLPVIEPAAGTVLECTSTADLSARGRVSATRAAARVEVGRTKTFLCLTGAEELLLKLEIRTTQQAGDLTDELALQ